MTSSSSQPGDGRDLLVRRLTPELGVQLAFDLAHLDLALRDVHRHADRPAVVLQAALNRLTDPQRAVGRELEPAPPVELLDRADQAEHSLLNQVLHRQAVALIAPRLRDDEPQVRVDHPLLGLEVTALDPLGELDLLGRRQQRVHAGLAHEQLERLERACRRCRRSAPQPRSRPVRQHARRAAGPAVDWPQWPCA